MNFFSGLLKGQGGPPGGEAPSLLHDWQDYSKSKDLEAGSSTDTLFRSVESTGTKVSSGISGIFTSGYETVSKGLPGLPSSDSFSIPTGQQLMLFFSFLAAGGVFLLLAFTIFLPVIILSPSKFAMSFTLGCLCIMAGFSALRGWKQQLTHMMSKERLPFSSAYVGSILATLYAALVMHSYIFSLMCSGLQVVALLYYILSYFPGGAQGVKFMLSLFYNALTSCFSVVLRQ